MNESKNGSFRKNNIKSMSPRALKFSIISTTCLILILCAFKFYCSKKLWCGINLYSSILSALTSARVITNSLIILFLYFAYKFSTLYSHSNLAFKRISIKLLNPLFLRRIGHSLWSLGFKYKKGTLCVVNASTEYFL